MCDHRGVSQMLTKTLSVSPMPIAVQKSSPRARARRYGMVRDKPENGIEVAQPFTSSTSWSNAHSTPACLSAPINTHDTVHKDCIALAFEPRDSTTPH